MSKQILILAGDGIGPEIVKAAEQVLARVNEKFNLGLTWEQGLLGGAAIDAHGEPYPAVTAAQAEKADAIFMGGSGGHLTDLIDWSMRQLHPAGRLVMTFILQENLNTALAHLDHLGVQGVDCLQLQVSSLTALGSGHYFKPNNPVFVIACQKEENHG